MAMQRFFEFFRRKNYGALWNNLFNFFHLAKHIKKITSSFGVDYFLPLPLIVSNELELDSSTCTYYVVGLNFIETELMQYLTPVGGGPSLNICPRCPPQLLHSSSTRLIP